MIIKIDNKTYINFNPLTNTSEVLKVDELEEKKAQLELEIEKLSDYSDEALLAWAKENFGKETSQILEAHKTALESINQELNEIYGN